MKRTASRRSAWSRRIVVVAVPPVDELDLVGPMPVFNSVNRLAGRTVYMIEVVTTARGLKVEGNVDVMRRAFVRLIGITPRRYRELRIT